MGEQAFLSTVSQPISAINTLRFNSDYKKNEALQKSNALTQGIYESVEAYQERMKQWRAEHAKKIAAENTTTAEKKYQDILSLYLNQTNDPKQMERGLSELQSLFRFTQFNNLNTSFDNKLHLAQKQERIVSERLYKYKNGQEADNSSVSNPMLYSGEFQNAGERDFLS